MLSLKKQFVAKTGNTGGMGLSRAKNANDKE
jgi:hypothetical protein